MPVMTAGAQDVLRGPGQRHGVLMAPHERERSPYSWLQKPPVEVVGDSIVFNPKSMTLGRFYVVELEGKPYLYRRVSETEVEVYGLADQAN